jgi:DNA-directed RNA polymerase subunit RPC12/RpoP
MTEICKLCGTESTPWESIDALDGYVCADCSYRLAALLVDDRPFSRDRAPQMDRR